MSGKRILVYGGKGALGLSLWVLSVDFLRNDNADANIVLEPTESLVEQGTFVKNEMNKVMGTDNKFAAIMCVAGGWAGGNAAASDMLANCNLVWQQSVWSSTISARIASLYLENKGLLQLTGAAPRRHSQQHELHSMVTSLFPDKALKGTPGMIGYGMAKAAVHHLTKSLAEPSSGLPDGVTVLAIAPNTLDTPMNRTWMPKADFKTWTSLDYVSELFHEWTVNVDSRPTSGSIVKMLTVEGKTSLETC